MAIARPRVNLGAPAASWVMLRGVYLDQSPRRGLEFRDMTDWNSAAGPSGVDLSESTFPPATSEGPGPLRRKQKQNTFLPLEGPGGPDRATLGGDAASRVTG